MSRDDDPVERAPYLGWAEIQAHPDAPQGGSGPGYSKDARALGLDRFSIADARPHPRSPAARGSGMTPPAAGSSQGPPTPEQVADIMHRKGWLTAEALMRRWARGKATTAPDHADPDTTTIKMTEWVLKFARARKVYDEMIADRVYVNPAAKERIVKLLIRKGKFGHSIATFDFTTGSVAAIDEDGAFANERYVGEFTDPLDDMTAALARFTLRATIAGEVRGKRVTIRKVGVYVVDSYDFNDDKGAWISQPLGFWNPKTGYAGLEPWKGTYLNNERFREYRQATGMGGDFKVYSDMKTTFPVPEDSFEANVAIEVPALGKGADSTIREIQDKLASLGYLDEKQADGYLGRFTRAAVRDFQANNGLAPDGDIGGPNSLTRKKLALPLSSLKGR